MKEKQEKVEKGMRKGIKKEDILKLTEEEKERIKMMREIDDRYIKNDIAKRCAVFADQAYSNLDKALGNAEACMFQLLSINNRRKKIKGQLMSGEIIDMYPNTVVPMSERDLEIEDILSAIKMGDHRRTLWEELMGIYSFVEQLKIDRTIFLSEEQYNKKVNWIIDELKKEGIDLFEERV